MTPCIWLSPLRPHPACFLIFSFSSSPRNVLFCFIAKKWKNLNKKKTFPLDYEIFNNFFICLIIRVCMFNRSWSTEHRYFDNRRRHINKAAPHTTQKTEIRCRHSQILFQKRWCEVISWVTKRLWINFGEFCSSRKSSGARNDAARRRVVVWRV